MLQCPRCGGTRVRPLGQGVYQCEESGDYDSPDTDRDICGWKYREGDPPLAPPEFESPPGREDPLEIGGAEERYARKRESALRADDTARREARSTQERQAKLLARIGTFRSVMAAAGNPGTQRITLVENKTTRRGKTRQIRRVVGKGWKVATSGSPGGFSRGSRSLVVATDGSLWTTFGSHEELLAYQRWVLSETPLGDDDLRMAMDVMTHLLAKSDLVWPSGAQPRGG